MSEGGGMGESEVANRKVFNQRRDDARFDQLLNAMQRLEGGLTRLDGDVRDREKIALEFQSMMKEARSGYELRLERVEARMREIEGLKTDLKGVDTQVASLQALVRWGGGVMSTVLALTVLYFINRIG